MDKRLCNSTHIIILAAGKGSRISNYTKQPKSLLQISNKSILESNIEKFINVGAKNFTLVLGYKDYLFKKIKWLWLDNFTRIELSHKFYKYLKRKKVKICMVSPELVKKSRAGEIRQLVKVLKKNKFQFDAVCTKKPNLWRALLNEK